MKYGIAFAIIFGFIYLSHIGSAVENGTLNIILSGDEPLLHNVRSAQITVVKVENNFENIFWKNNESLPFNLSFSVIPGVYKVYIKKDNFTVIEYNNDSIGYLVPIQGKVTIPANQTRNIKPQYQNAVLTDVLSDIPWRVHKEKKIPITYIIKDANEMPLYIRTITIYNTTDALVYTHPLGQNFDQDIWYDIDYISPADFHERDDHLNIHIKFDIAYDFDVHNFYTVNSSPYSLPSMPNWYYGDTHYHSFYTDNVMEFGAPIEPTALSGKAIGLDWVTITDHSFDLDVNRWNNLVSDGKNHSNNNFRVLPSEEVSCTVPGGIYQEYNHYLSYNITDFVPGGEWEDGTGSNYNCSELISLVNDQKGFGYPAHPMYSDEFHQLWHDYSLNFTGLEIWNGAGNIAELSKGMNKWVELLLGGRKIFVEAGSDAHGHFNSGFGKVRTSVYALNFSDSEISSALRNGHSIMTDGPFVIFEINGTMIGNTLKVTNGSIINLDIQWNSTPEFGNLDNITIIKGNIGSNETIEKIYYPASYSGTDKITLSPIQNVYYRLSAFTSAGYRAYTNPIWVNVSVSPLVPTMNITSWGNNYTNDHSLIITIPSNKIVRFNITTNYNGDNYTIDSNTSYKSGAFTDLKNFYGDIKFNSAGTFWVTVGASNNTYGSDTKKWIINVVMDIPPTADCGSDKLTCENVGAPVYFNASASYDPDGAIVSYLWDFGDGTNGTGMAPRHTYASYKWNSTMYQPFIVNLTVTDNNGLTNSTSQKVVMWIAGDANGDGRVNILDAALVGLKWGTNDPCADLNNDGKVNILDASIIGLNWGKSA